MQFRFRLLNSHSPPFLSLLLFPLSSYSLSPPIPSLLLFPLFSYFLYPPIPSLLLFPLSSYSLSPPLPSPVIFHLSPIQLYHNVTADKLLDPGKFENLDNKFNIYFVILVSWLSLTFLLVCKAQIKLVSLKELNYLYYYYGTVHPLNHPVTQLVATQQSSHLTTHSPRSSFEVVFQPENFEVVLKIFNCF